jgi:hypothetical protein
MDSKDSKDSKDSDARKATLFDGPTNGTERVADSMLDRVIFVVLSR